MPRGTVSTESIRKELKSCPGGYVELKQLPFGKVLARRDKILRQTQEINPNAKQGDSAKVQIDIMNEWSRQYDFKNCIVDHNIEDEHGSKLDFGNPMTLDILDPRIGQEIEKYIDELNQEDFDAAGFTSQSGTLLTGENGDSSREPELPT